MFLVLGWYLMWPPCYQNDVKVVIVFDRHLEKKLNWDFTHTNSYFSIQNTRWTGQQASAGRRLPRLPGFPKSLFPFWDSSFLSQKVAHQPWRPWTKTRTSSTTLGRERGLQRSRTVRTSTSSGVLLNSQIEQVISRSDPSEFWRHLIFK